MRVRVVQLHSSGMLNQCGRQNHLVEDRYIDKVFKMVVVPLDSKLLKGLRIK